MSGHRHDTLELTADVLIIGGGLAGTWAAAAARRTGASVILVDKGYCGTSGVTATAGPGHWWVPQILPNCARTQSAAVSRRGSD
ncbi:FAD-dependent oxidoreductase [Phyllobacterium sophorae]|uniref:FAD-dependent oxidoreductase n=1 Tax=Phyllobacterium sophorae TaxID=1520277 RepID=UPI001FE10E45|nr:FAD-dependent oxidoreductase [Phyllobacterium sophorae]